MAVNKVVYNTGNGAKTLIDLTGDSVTPETLAEGTTAHDASGERIVGTMPIYKNLTLGVHTDGLLYVFSDGQPIGNGIEMPDKIGDVYGNIDSDNNIILKGYMPDGTYTAKFETDDGRTVNIGTLILDTNVYYSITKNLTYCTINNSATQAVKGNSYSATITANSGYTLKSVSVTMGGSSVSVSGGVINISNVSGDIVINAVAEEKTKEPTNLFVVGGDGYVLNGRCSSGGANRTDSDGCLVTNYIKVSKGDTVYLNKEIVSTVHSGMKLNDGSVTGFLPTDTNYITNLSSSNGITQFTVNNTNANYIRLCIKINYGTVITDTDVINAGVIVTVNEPLS
jgi:hypothetical protein